MVWLCGGTASATLGSPYRPLSPFPAARTNVPCLPARPACAPICLPGFLPPVQDDKERLRAQVALTSQGTGASEARLAEREEYIQQLQ